jgi:hypothetical protein
MFNTFYKATLLLLVLLSAFTKNTYAQIDSEAVVVLDKMSDVVTGLESCNFVLKTEYDIYNERLGLVKHSDVSDVYLKAPDKLHIKRSGDAGYKSLFCDGKTFTYYSADNNQYSTIPALETIMETIDSIHNEYGIDFPAADIFYPELVDELIEKSEDISYLGLTNVDDKECHHIAGTTNLLTYQLWVSSDDFLPLKMVLVYTSRDGSPQYEAIFRKWTLNPVLENSIFNFVVPEKANKVIFKKKI